VFSRRSRAGGRIGWGPSHILAAVGFCALGCGGSVAPGGDPTDGGSTEAPAADATPSDSPASPAPVDGESRDAGSDVGDGASPTDSASYQNDAGLDILDGGPGITVCGPNLCAASSEVCCFEGVSGYSCVPHNACVAGVILECSSTLSCGAGNTCCGNLDGEEAVGSSECRAACQADQVLVCENSAQCPVGRKCDSVGLAVGFCFPRGDGG
jgi:hypothetical protein